METLGIAYFLHVVGYSNSILAGRSGTRIINQCDLLRDKTINQPTVANEECGRFGIVVHLPRFCISYTLSHPRLSNGLNAVEEYVRLEHAAFIGRR